MNLKSYVVQQNRRTVSNAAVIRMLSSHSLTQSQFKLFAAQRGYMATNFVRLLAKGVRLAKVYGDAHLADVLQTNLNDELGMDKDGVTHTEKNHRVWKVDYLSALGINPDVPGFPLLSSTRTNVEAMCTLEAEGDLFAISGAILALENIIPLEYAAAVVARDYLFPELFRLDPNDNESASEIKRKARLYMDDHIVHDAASHFPDLLCALAPYESHDLESQLIRKGIDTVAEFREKFYCGLATAFDFGPEINRFFWDGLGAESCAV